MKQIRIENIDDVVPLDYQHRQDFVLHSEMIDLCSKVGERYGFDLDGMLSYYKLKI